MKKTIHVKRRISVLLGLCALIVALIAGRLFYLQILNPEYRQKMLELMRKTIELFPTRGSITDRDGYTLAYDENAYVLYLFPEEIEDKEALRQQIMEILPADQETVDTWLNGEGTITADIDISQEQADALMAIEARGLSVITQNQRRYAESLSAGSLIGFTGQDHRGAVGLEAYYEDLLKGTPGKMRLFSYSGGIPVPYEQEVQYPKKEGYSLSLTIDSALQEIVVEKGRKGFERMQPRKMSILAMDPNTGEMLAWADFPLLDAANPRRGRTEQEIAELAQMTEEERVDRYYSMWRSFSAQDVYEPGSVFKVITAAAAYEEGTATDETEYYCDGAIRDIPGVLIRCWSYDEPHGHLTFTEAMDESCNPSFVQMIRALGKENSKEYIDAFGFGEKTGVGFPSEEEGIVPPDPEEINEATFATNSYGHGIAVTPLQMIRAIATTVNGGVLYQPQIVNRITDADGETVQSFAPKPLRTVISENTSARMRALLEHGVEHGTADGGRIPGYRVGGKTGTSVKFVDGAYSTETVVGSYVAVFPADAPELVLLVVVDEPQDRFSGNSTAAPVAKEILEAYIALNGMEPVTDTDTNDKEEPQTENTLTWPADPDGEEEEVDEEARTAGCNRV